MKKLLLAMGVVFLWNAGYSQTAGNLARKIADAVITEHTEQAVLTAAKRNEFSALRQALSKAVVPSLVVNVADKKTGRTPLMFACINGNFEMVKFLVQNGAFVNTEDNYQNTALGYALEYKRAKTADYLLKCNAQSQRDMLVRAGDPFQVQKPLLLVALDNGLYQAALQLFEKETRPIWTQSYDEETLLEAAARQGYKDLVLGLLNRGALVTRFAIEAAYNHSHMDIFKILLVQPKVAFAELAHAFGTICAGERDDTLWYVKTFLRIYRPRYGEVYAKKLVNSVYAPDPRYNSISFKKPQRMDVITFLRKNGAETPSTQG